MDNPTRRLDRSELPPELDAETRRLDEQPYTSYQQPYTPTLRCLRCSGEMVATMAWPSGFGGYTLTLAVAIPYLTDLTAIPCYSSTCLSCGYTEIYASNLTTLRAEYARFKDQLSAEEIKRRTAPQQRISVAELNRIYAEEQAAEAQKAAQKRKSRR